MFQAKKYVIQAEFFLIDLFTRPLEIVMNECAERANDESRIKENIRFFDASCRIARMVEKWSIVDKKCTDYQPNSIMPWIYDLRARSNAKLRIKIMEHLKKEIASSAELAIMEDDFSFRPLLESERHELIETISGSTRAMVFVFEADTLLTNRQTILFRMV